MRTCLLLLLGIGLAAAEPNIVFVIADDLGYGDLGCYGQETTRTPVLDKLPAEGVRFTQHYSGSTVCAPSRSSLMTGLDTGRTWLRGNGEFELHSGKSYDAELFTARAERFIRETDGPFFLLLSYPIPHASVLGPEGSVPGGAGMEHEKGHYTEVKNPKAHYRAMVEAMDGYMGRVLAALGEKGVARDTLVIFTSDNGSHSVGGYDPEMLNSSGPLRGAKRDLYEGGIRVPMIAHWPAGITEAGTSDHISAFWDFLPI